MGQVDGPYVDADAPVAYDAESPVRMMKMSEVFFMNWGEEWDGDDDNTVDAKVDVTQGEDGDAAVVLPLLLHQDGLLRPRHGQWGAGLVGGRSGWWER